jgi:hypothetical protein
VIKRVLIDQEIRSNAFNMAKELAALPTRDDAADVLLALASADAAGRARM